VLTDATISVLVQRGRSYFMNPAVIAGITGRKLKNHAWIPSDGYDVVVVKVGYLFPGQVDEAKSWYMAITPGGTDLDFERLRFDRVWRPIYPLDTDFEADLTAEVLQER
jgi:microcystin degradation protein MlrC